MHEIHDDVHGPSGQSGGLPEALASVDLNLLVAFDALVRERHVTRAAARVGLSQSAMSHALRRLRELLGDPLLVRGGRGMVATPKAEALAVPLRSGLVTLHRALTQPASFEAATARRAFRMTSPDLFDLLVLPAMLQRIRKTAPGVDLAIVGGMSGGVELSNRLETGEVDVAVVPRLQQAQPDPDAPAEPGLVRRTLFRDDLVCILSADHPALETRKGRRAKSPRLTAERYAELSHVMVSPTGRGKGPVDRALAARGLRRRVALRVPSFAAGLAIVARSDLALTGPTGLMKLGASSSGLVALRPPLAVPGHSIDLVWHERFSEDPAHRWFRELIVAVAPR